ncbi:MAG: HAD-IA family hydrolase [Lachnospiraceae bacterium]|nr:HAD-IA family hydrolase [Lachnospiraceae bacterium]
MIKNIIFDIGNVLAHFRWKEFIRERFPEEQFERIAKATVQGPYWVEVDRGVLSMEEIVRRCTTLAPELGEQIAQFFRERPALVREYDYAEALLQRLKKRGYRVYLLSNYAGDLYEYAKEHFRFVPLVDGGVISYQIHQVKPEPEIYEALLKKYDLKPEECVFLDDLEQNLKVAEQFGIRAILFRDYASAMRELAELLGRRYSTLIFDVDGTLWDSTEEAAKIWSEVAAKYPEIRDTVTAEKLRGLYGLPLEDIAVRLFESAPEELAIQVMEECVQVQCPILAEKGGRLMGDVAGAFRRLGQNYRIFIVSNCRSGYIEAFLEAHHLGELVEDFTCPGDTGKLKAENIRLICEKNGVPLSEAVYVGDTAPDERAASEAGVPFVFAAYGFGQVDRWDYRVEDITQLCDPAMFL